MQDIESFAHRKRRGFLGWVFGAFIFIIIIGAIVAPILFGGYGYGMMGPYSYYYPHPFFGWFSFPFGFFFLLFILFFAFRWLFFPWRGRHYYGRWGYREGEAEEILRQRYAKGEITKEQFEQMMRDLQQNR